MEEDYSGYLAKLQEQARRHGDRLIEQVIADLPPERKASIDEAYIREKAEAEARTEAQKEAEAGLRKAVSLWGPVDVIHMVIANYGAKGKRLHDKVEKQLNAKDATFIDNIWNYDLPRVLITGRYGRTSAYVVASIKVTLPRKTLDALKPEDPNGLGFDHPEYDGT